jgi:transcriptional regulator GlxA family with amidase domain
MNRLNGISEWERLAQEARYGIRALARRCGISTRQLGRHFRATFHQPPHAWLHALRLQRALERLRARS